MAQPVILTLPAALALYAVSIALALFERKTRATRGALTWVSAALAIGAAAWALLGGADLREGAALLMGYALPHMEVSA